MIGRLLPQVSAVGVVCRVCGPAAAGGAQALSQVTTSAATASSEVGISVVTRVVVLDDGATSTDATPTSAHDSLNALTEHVTVVPVGRLTSKVTEVEAGPVTR